jgi:cytochrome P450
MSDAPVVHVDPQSFWDDPYPKLAEMRAEAPTCFVPELNSTLLTKRDDIHICEKNVAVFSSDQPAGLMNQLMGHNMMRRDGDDHRAERFAYYPAVSPKTVKEHWTAEFVRIVDEQLAALPDTGEVDFVPAIATAISGEALKMMTGLTHVTHQELDAWSQGMIDGVANYLGDPDIEARCHWATAAIDAAIDERLPAIQAEPDNSLLSVMHHGGMSEEKVRANIKLTISGGQNEPRDALAGAVWALLSNRDQLEKVSSGGAAWLNVFEEYCRWIGPIGMSPRVVAETHTFGGVTFLPEDRVFFMFGSAGRDESHFDEPDMFDVGRDTGPSLHFGAGPHFCAGAAASRSLVGEIALPKIFERFPNLELAGEVPFGGWAFRGPLTMPVALG